jgi:hypothetical protein
MYRCKLYYCTYPPAALAPTYRTGGAQGYGTCPRNLFELRIIASAGAQGYGIASAGVASAG